PREERQERALGPRVRRVVGAVVRTSLVRRRLRGRGLRLLPLDVRGVFARVFVLALLLGGGELLLAVLVVVVDVGALFTVRRQRLRGARLAGRRLAAPASTAAAPPRARLLAFALRGRGRLRLGRGRLLAAGRVLRLHARGQGIGAHVHARAQVLHHVAA